MSDKTGPCWLCLKPTDRVCLRDAKVFRECAVCNEAYVVGRKYLDEAYARRPIMGVRDPLFALRDDKHCFRPENLIAAMKADKGIGPSDFLELAAECLRECGKFEDYPELDKAVTEIEFVALSEQKMVRADSDPTDGVPECY